MPKLKFKRSPEEESKYQAHKARRKEQKRKRRTSESYSYDPSRRSHRETDDEVTFRRWASSDGEDTSTASASGPRGTKADGLNTGRDPGWFSNRRDDGALGAEAEDQAFRDRLFDAMGHDERLDGLESQFNGYVHVPDRWKAAATGTAEKSLYDNDEFLKLNPNALDDDEYAEWVRLGMYRKSHAAEHAEHLRRKAAAAERRAAEKAQRAEARRAEKQAEEERRAKRRVREEAKKAQAKEDYHERWRVLLEEASNRAHDGRELAFAEIPWPIYHTPAGDMEEDFTKGAITAFLLAGVGGEKKVQKDILRETLLRYHPDKFEGRFMPWIQEGDRERVREAIGQISRVLNRLLEEV